MNLRYMNISSADNGYTITMECNGDVNANNFDMGQGKTFVFENVSENQLHNFDALMAFLSTKFRDVAFPNAR
jgi:hypothetical protein